MLLKIWAFSFATIGVLSGIFALKNKKWKTATWIICLSLLVFVGENIRFNDINPSVSNSFNFTKEIADIKSGIKNIKLDVKQAIALKQEINQTVTVVTRVEKEIVNIKEAIQQIYNQATGEIFEADQLNNTVRIFGQNKKRRVIYFELKNIPIINSIEITSQSGAASPATFSSLKNIVYHRTSEKFDKILSEDPDFYYIKYYKDNFSEDHLLTLKDMIYEGTDDNPNKASFRKMKEKTIEHENEVKNKDS